MAHLNRIDMLETCGCVRPAQMIVNLLDDKIGRFALQTAWSLKSSNLVSGPHDILATFVTIALLL